MSNNQTMHLAYFISPSDLNVSLCSEYSKAIVSCLTAMADNIDTVEDESFRNSIISDIVNNRGTDAMDSFNSYHKENKTGISVGFTVIDAIDADAKYETDRLAAFGQEHIKWTE